MPTVHQAFKYKLDPTPEQERQFIWTLARCRELYNAALQERRDAWRMRRVSIGYHEQSAQLPGVKEVRSEYKDIHAQVLQVVLKRLDHAFQTFFQRVKQVMYFCLMLQPANLGYIFCVKRLISCPPIGAPGKIPMTAANRMLAMPTTQMLRDVHARHGWLTGANKLQDSHPLP